MTNILSRVGACLAFTGVAAFSLAGDLSIGDKAPAFNPEGWVKGSPMKLEPGKSYVVEFWATWCGPCISSMPHLSDMADKYKGQIEFISVNTWDRNEGTEKTAGDKGHVERVAKFVKENESKMRYNIALDDEKDTISTTWMRAAGRNGIPCAFIVNADGVIAWIGHPMSMDEPLEQMAAGNFDLKAAKEKYDAEMAAAKARAAQMKSAQDAMAAAGKANDMDAFNKAFAKLDEIEDLKGNDGIKVSYAVQALASQAPAFALTFIESKMGKVDLDATDWCSLLSMVTRMTKDQEVKDRSIMMSADCAGKATKENQAIAFAYHAQNLSYGGKKDQAREFVKKAMAAVDNFEPAASRDNIRKFIDNVSAQVEKA